MASAPEDPPISPSSPPPPPQSSKPFRFKRKRRHSLSISDPEPPTKRRDSTSPSNTHRHSSRHSHHHHHHRHHHRSRRRPQTPIHDPTHCHDDTTFSCGNHEHSKPLDPDTAFRESLFDALADDEGASFWEGVYGQPIHHYSPYKENDDMNDDYYDDAGAPKLERMSDEEYVSYVRCKMWERSHQYIFEERRKREEQRKLKEVKREEERKWQLGVEEALRRGAERRKSDRWRRVWEGYVAKWETTFSSSAEEGSMKERISWPVESGVWEDVKREEIERFFRHAPQATAARMGEETDLGDVLKKERVRWHPDKMQQRTGSAGIDEGTMKIVTAVFQVVDRLWSENKGRG